MRPTLREILSVVIALLLADWIAGCPQPLPPTPPGPTPVTDAAPLRDRFAGGVFDCTLLDTTRWQPYAATCGDTSDVSMCMNDYAASMVDPTPLICAARDVQVAGFIEIAKRTATPEVEDRARALRAWLAWLNTTGTTLRSAP